MQAAKIMHMLAFLFHSDQGLKDFSMSNAECDFVTATMGQLNERCKKNFCKSLLMSPVKKLFN